jgi:hypothetical protein
MDLYSVQATFRRSSFGAVAEVRFAAFGTRTSLHHRRSDHQLPPLDAPGSYLRLFTNVSKGVFWLIFESISTLMRMRIASPDFDVEMKKSH